MSSPLTSEDAVDRTKTPTLDILIRWQKRAFTTDVISDPWVEGQRKVLMQFKDGTRVVSARTLTYIDDMISQCNDALGEVEKGEYFEEIVEGLHRAAEFLEARLEMDDKFADELASFQSLGQENILLKYGDYYAEGCNKIRSMATGPDKKLLQGKKWEDIVQDLDLESNALQIWENQAMKGARPYTPIKNLLFKISLLWEGFSQDQLVYMMRFYADRNALADNGPNELIKERKWVRLATHLRQDYHAVKTFYPQTKDSDKAELLQKIIESCQKNYFDWIQDEWDGPVVSVEKYKLKDELIAEDDKIIAAQQKAKEDAESAAKLEKLILERAGEEPFSDDQMAELVAAQTEYQQLLNDEKKKLETAEKRKIEENARHDAAKAKIATAKTRLEKALRRG